MKTLVPLIGVWFAITATSATPTSESYVPTNQDIECLAMNMYFEARGEGTTGKLAVATVTLNRAAHPKFPNSICEVVYQKTKVKEKTVCQFSWYCNPAARLNTSSKQYKASIVLAIRLFTENLHITELKDALYFHNEQVSPNWNLPKVATIGNHTFYSAKPARRSPN